VRVADTRSAPPLQAALQALQQAAPQAAGPGAVELRTGAFAPDLLDDVDLVAIGPGLSPAHSAATALLQAAAARGIEVVGEIELFARALAQLKAARGYAPRVVGITGTNGKTTVTQMTGLLLARSGRSVAVAGNISPSALMTLLEREATGTLPDTWVLELSSFQLATTRSLDCDAAAVLNLTQDHLDWHGTMADYAAAKARIFGAGAASTVVQVLNRDDPQVAAMARRNATVVSFGLGAPTEPASFGLVRDGALDWLAYAEDLSPGHRRRKAAAELPGVDGPVHVQRLMPTDALRVRGRHNAANALAALALGRAIGAPLAPMLHALRDYAGEPHRVQRVATIAGVDWIDDSKGTNVGATVAAIVGLGGEGRKLVVLLGGDGKGQDFAPLVAPLAAHARAVVLIGRDGPAIGQVLAAADGGPACPVVAAATLPAAVELAAAHARPGDAVLLSPACASLDMFSSYRQRAEVFVAAVLARQAEAATTQATETAAAQTTETTAAEAAAADTAAAEMAAAAAKSARADG
jgi:UDP-N-acetylmuramoylalanine--D-glutamate ligase